MVDAAPTFDAVSLPCIEMHFVCFRFTRFAIVLIFLASLLYYFWHPLLLTLLSRCSSYALLRFTFPFIPHPSTVFPSTLTTLTLILHSGLLDHLLLDS